MRYSRRLIALNCEWLYMRSASYIEQFIKLLAESLTEEKNVSIGTIVFDKFEQFLNGQQYPITLAFIAGRDMTDFMRRNIKFK